MTDNKHAEAVGLEARIARILADDPICFGRVSTASVEKIAALAALNTRPDVEAEQVAFNVNEAVWVKLTDEGRRQHRARHQQQYPMLDYRAPDESDNGWSKWQLWLLMRELGPDISMGGPPLFATTIRIDATDIRSIPVPTSGEGGDR